MSDQPPGAPSQDDDARFAKIEAEQAAQRGILEEIRDKLTGTSPPPVPDSGVKASDPPADMAEQMRQAVRDVNAERDQADAKAKPPPPEQQPREVMIKGKARLQRAVFGGDP